MGRDTMNKAFQFYREYKAEPAENEIYGLILSNGMQVVLMKRQTTPVVAIDIWYKVGSKDEEQGKSGFAHLFEHMMFEGSENVDKAQHMKLINDIGGMVNGSTTQDRTNYWEVVPSNQIELALWLEADRMRSLNVTKENFENQRATVKEERRLRIDNQPYMKVVYELKDEIAYTNFAYKHSIIGSMADLDHASLSGVKEFHNIYYRPNNAVMSIVGDFTVKEAVNLVKKYFDNIPPGEKVPEVNLDEPPQESLKKTKYEDQFAPFPAFMISFRVPDRRHRDFYTLQLIEKILIDGESSRLYRQLIEKKQVALHIFGGLDGKFGPGLFFIFAQVYPGKKLSDLEKILTHEFNLLVNETITEKELEKAKNKIKAEYIVGQETVRSLADILCMYTTVYGNPNKFFEEIMIFNSITSEEIKSVAYKYFIQKNSSIIEIFPKNHNKYK